ncbi:SDR family NAD(P)-dependent oxidoreductase [Streptomyces sp. NPDC002476]|uniref:SDR family NAD(P)-dependent oxidoreductase n=1 Tax=Streptomyces sp. NPDC002476 TaxID=3364648 RepID=UPI0036C8DE22
MSVLDVFRIDGARALVTGASRGIGRAVALVLVPLPATFAPSHHLARAPHRTPRAPPFGRTTLLSKHVLARSTRPSLILQSSVGGLIGPPLLDARAASKAGQLSLTRSPATGWARQDIRVDAVCPGWGHTDMTSFASGTDELSDWLMAHAPPGRWGEPEEVAYAVLYLASPASAFATGYSLGIGGGLSVPDAGLAGIPKPL